MELYHYYDIATGPFRNLSDLPRAQAAQVMDELRVVRPGCQAAQRDAGYLDRRESYESAARALFVQMGGRPKRSRPHSMVVEACPWLWTWFTRPACLHIPFTAFDPFTVSFTYGDLHPTFSPLKRGGEEYRAKLYFYDGICDLIARYDLPQRWNADGRFGPERYIEAQIWDDAPLAPYLGLACAHSAAYAECDEK